MELRSVHRARPGLVWPTRVDPTGRTGPTRGQSQGPGWRRVSHGHYLPADLPITLDQRIVNAAAVLPAVGGVTGWAALRWYGGRWFDGTADGGRTERPVDLTTSAWDVRSQPGIAVTGENRRYGEEIHLVDGLRVTSAAWAVLFEMRHAANLWDAVVAHDMAARDDLVTGAAVADAVMRQINMTGIPQARLALALGDENSWSPPETRLRLIWMSSGLPRLRCNQPLFDHAGRHIATPDLLDVAAALAIEYDGALHLDRRQRHIDLLREDKIRDHGLEYLAVTAEDLRAPGVLARRLHQARARAVLTTSRRDRGWTIFPPPGTPLLTTVCERRLHEARRRGA